MTIYFGLGDNVNTDLNLRYILADTIEERGWARVLEEGTGEGCFNLYLEIGDSELENNKEEIISLVKSLGFNNCEFILPST